MIGGYIGKILRVDLTEQKTCIVNYDEETLRKYIGGSGLGARILFDETTPETDPLGPDNLLIFLTGPMTATKAINFGRHQVITKSPLTGGYGEANSGGTWGKKLKNAGYDGIICTGKADKPVYIWVNEGEVEIRDASHLWGKDTYETDQILKDELGRKITVCSIGQAGENLVKFAAIMNDGVDGRAAGRCGVGTVMGSKNLKAIAVFGTFSPEVIEKEKFNASIKKWAVKVREDSVGLREYGTSGGLKNAEQLGDLPVKNWSEGSFTSGGEKICGQRLAETRLTKYYHCAQCVIGCGRTVHVKEGPYAGIEGSGPEYETTGVLGANCKIDDLDAIIKANELCNRYGLDTISTGGAIAFAMECYEKGILDKEQCGGIELKWGDALAMVKMVQKIAFREDIGDILSKGIREASEAIGHNSCEFAVHVRGLDFPAHDPRAANGIALQYATSPRGACHLSSFSQDFEFGMPMPEDVGYVGDVGRFVNKGKGEYVARMQDIMCLFDSLTGCKFIMFFLGDHFLNVITEWLNMITGWDVTQEEILETGNRIFTLKRMYNVRLGQSRKDDTLPYRMLTHKRSEGGASDNLPHIGLMLSELYEYRGWDETGIPTEETLEKLGL